MINKINKYVVIDIVLFIVISLLGIYILFFMNTDKLSNNKVDLVDYESIELDDKFNLKDFKILESSAFYIKNEGTSIYLKVENTSLKEYFLQGVTAVIYNKKGKVIANLYYNNPLYIDVGQTVDYSFNTKKYLLSSISRVEYIPNYKIIEEKE